MSKTLRHLDYYNEERRKHLISAEMLAWWDGSYSNKDNTHPSDLKYCADGEIQSKPTILFSNWDGDNSNTITLNDNINKYDRLLIHYKDNVRHHITSKIVKAKNALITLDALTTDNTTMRLSARTYLINNTTLTSTKSLVILLPANTRYETNELAILEIDGFKK